MTTQLEGYPYAEVRFDKAARLVDDDEPAGLRRMLDGDPGSHSRVTDLVVLAHGWNNDMDEARALYQRIAVSLRAQQASDDGRLVAGRTLGLLGVLWPSKKFADEELIPGGAASFGEDAEEQLEQRIDDLRDAFDADDAPERLDEARRLASSLEDSRAARERFVELLRHVVPDDAGDDEDASQEFLEADADDLFRQLDDPTLDDPTLHDLGMRIPPPSESGGGAATLDDLDAPSGGAGGAAAGFGLTGKAKSARRLLNFATYYQMKARAGRVGSTGLGPLLWSIDRPGLRLHLVGHSFGGRLVTAAAVSGDGPGGTSSLVLLQAAFSHYGFAENWKPNTDGAFRRVLTGGRLSGPLVITHTRNDKAVGIAYALASRIANQVGAEFGGPGSRFGGIGANGAQLTPEAVTEQLLRTDRTYSFTKGAVHNLRADEFIPDHGAVWGREVAHVILSAASAS
jgi:pimeloyl-ACP methyl ester carboxylesterase